MILWDLLISNFLLCRSQQAIRKKKKWIEPENWYLHSWLVPVPDLNGKWKGNIHYYWDGTFHDKATEVRIVQTFLHIQVQIKTDESWSNSICSSFDIDEDKGIRQLIYSYLNVPKASVREEVRYIMEQLAYILVMIF